MKVVVTQPNFLPWLGYFHQLHYADVFVVLDNVQFSRREWQNRNRIIDRKGIVKYVTVPIKKAPQKTLIKDIRISQSFEFSSLKSIILSSYNGLPGAEYVDILLKSSFIEFENKIDENLLSDFNLKFIQQIVDEAGIQVQTILSSKLGLDSESLTATERILNICLKLGATSYLSSCGAKDYMSSELYKFNKAGIKVLWQSFEHRPYLSHSHNKPFVSHLSIVDFLSHCSIVSLSDYLNKCGSFTIDAA